MKGKMLPMFALATVFLIPLFNASSYGSSNAEVETIDIIVGENGYCNAEEGYFTYDNHGSQVKLEFSLKTKDPKYPHTIVLKGDSPIKDAVPYICPRQGSSVPPIVRNIIRVEGMSCSANSFCASKIYLSETTIDPASPAVSNGASSKEDYLGEWKMSVVPDHGLMRYFLTISKQGGMFSMDGHGQLLGKGSMQMFNDSQMLEYKNECLIFSAGGLYTFCLEKGRLFVNAAGSKAVYEKIK